MDPERSEALRPIKRSDIFAYARDYDLSEEQTEDMVYYIREMDRAHLKREAAKLKPPPKAPRRGK